jgi:hypothetical protein
MPFDTEAARQAGYTDAEIAEHLATQNKFDVAGARAAGYADADIIQHLSAFDAPKPATAGQRGMAAVSGGWAGLANLLGTPVDAVMNVWDLGKAGVGTVQGLATGKTPSDALLPSDRTQYVGSSDWIKSKLNKGGIETAPQRPDDRASRWIHNAANIGTGVYLGSALPSPTPIPNPRPTSLPRYPVSSAAANSNAASSAGVNVGAGQAGAQAGMSGSLNASIQGGGYNFGTVADDAASGLTRGQQLARDGFRQGRLTPGQATGNKLLQRLEAKLESQPMTAGPFDRIKDTNIREVNRAVSRAIGENADNLSSDVLDRAVTRMGTVFDDVRDDAQRAIDPAEFVSRMQSVRDEFEAIGPQLWNHPLVTRLVSHAEHGTATGRDLGNLTSKLTRESHRQMTSPQGDRELGMALGRLKDYVDDLVEQGLSGERLARYQATREQYRNLSLLTSRVGTINPSTGNVNSSALANLLQQKDRSGFLFGRNQSDMYNAARFGQAFRPIVGDSGTATRMPLPSPTDFVLSLPFNLATRAYTSSPAVSAAVNAQAASQAAAQAVAPFTQGLARPMMTPGGLLGGVNNADDIWSR